MRNSRLAIGLVAVLLSLTGCASLAAPSSGTTVTVTAVPESVKSMSDVSARIEMVGYALGRTCLEARADGMPFDPELAMELRDANDQVISTFEVQENSSAGDCRYAAKVPVPSGVGPVYLMWGGYRYAAVSDWSTEQDLAFFASWSSLKGLDGGTPLSDAQASATVNAQDLVEVPRALFADVNSFSSWVSPYFECIGPVEHMSRPPHERMDCSTIDAYLAVFEDDADALAFASDMVRDNPFYCEGTRDGSILRMRNALIVNARLVDPALAQSPDVDESSCS